VSDTAERALRVFQCDGQTDWVVAYDAEDAALVWLQHNGYETPASFAEANEKYGWELPSFEEYTKPGLTIMCDADGDPSDEGANVTRTPAEWAEREGRGFLCSTEF
jgi:hypothetical protein